MTGEASVLADRYRLADSIGRGGMADVFAAEDTSSGRMVAVKIMRMGEQADPDRFASEMQILERLSHPAIVQMFDSGTTDDASPYFVMQLVDGDSLSASLRNDGPLDAEEAADIGSRVASALAHAHEMGVVHRDIKPANILVDSDGGAYLTDFGVARLADATLVTRAGTTIGTAAYLAPEQLQDSQVSPAADVYSLGLVLLESLTGRRAFRGTGVEAAMSRLSRDPSVPRTLPDPWVPLLIAMTRRAPDRRPSASEVESTLRGTAPPPICSADELAARSFDPARTDEEPTAVVGPGDTGPTTGGSQGSGSWDPPSGGTATPVPRPAPAPPSQPPPGASAPTAASPQPSAGQPDPSPVAATPSPALAAPGVAGARPTGDPATADDSQPNPAAEPPITPPSTVSPVTPPAAPTPAAGIPLAAPTPAAGIPAAGPQGTSAPSLDPPGAPDTPTPPPGAPRRGMDSIRSRALLVGLALGGLVVALLVGVFVLFVAPADDPVTGRDPVDDATREVLAVLDASERLGATDPALQRDLVSLSEGVVQSVNEDRWDAALLGVIDMTNTARDAIEALDIQPVALEGLLGSLRDLAREIESAAAAGTEVDDGG